jgi:hypothetical protein
MILNEGLYVRVRKDLLLAIAALLISAAMLYGSLMALSTPTSYSFEVQSGLVSTSNPTITQESRQLEQEHQETVDMLNQLQNR